jgi:2-desacetyl-2-hydroxyethyl bacteriochlorophyllide A dehydrogenase
MKSLVWEGPKIMNMRDAAKPSLALDEVLIRVALVGICGSELSGYLGHNALRVPPLVMGHEFSGEIVELGADALEINAKLFIGQRVTANPLSSCGHCNYCQAGLNHLCASRKLIGAHRAGAFAEFVSVPASSVHGLPEGMSLQTGALAEPAAVAVRIGHLAGDIGNQSALVLGAGPIGLLAMQVLKARGAKTVYIADLDPERLAMAAALGGEALQPKTLNLVQTVRDATDAQGVTVAVDAVGSGVTRAQCVSATRSAGTVILSGLHEETSTIPAAEIIRREINLQGSFAYTPANFEEALRLLENGTIKLEGIVHAPLADGGLWFERLLGSPGNVSKVLLEPA